MIIVRRSLEESASFLYLRAPSARCCRTWRSSNYWFVFDIFFVSLYCTSLCQCSTFLFLFFVTTKQLIYIYVEGIGERKWESKGRG